MDKNIFGVYLAKEGVPNNEAYAKLDLPASPWALWDAMDKVRLQEGETLYLEINEIIRKLAKCGWFIISKDPKTNIDFIYIPAYSIQFIKLLNELTTDAGAYLPLVHQTYSELKLEDEKEDDYMYRSLINAKNNAESLEMSVTLLRQQILVFGNRLTNVDRKSVV